MSKKYKRYRKKDDFSYTIGPFPTFEMLESANVEIIHVFLHEDFHELEKLMSILENKGISYSFSPKVLRRISGRDNAYVIGVFKKEEKELEKGNHLLLENIRDMGNLGNILRSSLAFQVKNIALIGNTVDFYDPRVIRASMGAYFKVNLKHFDSLEDYKKTFSNKIYAFELNDRAKELSDLSPGSPFTLAFGNEGEGLSQDFEREESVFIDQSEEVDSLNLHTAVAISLYTLRERL